MPRGGSLVCCHTKPAHVDNSRSLSALSLSRLQYDNVALCRQFGNFHWFFPLISVSLIITTYNWPSALNVVLRSVESQSVLPTEIIIADDGSGDNTVRLINDWRGRLPLKHTWIRDDGFRVARSRNAALLKASCDYIIMVDGDCLMPSYFIEQHIKFAKPNMLVSGGRHLYDQATTSKLLSDNIHLPEQAFRALKFWSIPFGPLRNIGANNWKKVRTCNLGVWRHLALKIAGFDEAYVGWGKEDSDFVVRLIRSEGVRVRNGRFGVCVGHLDHVERSRDSLWANEERFIRNIHRSSPGTASESFSILVDL